MLIVGVSFDAAALPTVQFGGTTMTLLGNRLDPSSVAHVGLWSLAVAGGASGTIMVTFGLVHAYIVGGSVSYFNVASTGIPVSNDDVGFEGPTALDLVATTAGDLVVDTLAISNVGGTATTISPTGSGQMQRWNSGSLGGIGMFSAGGGSDRVASGSTVTMSWSISQISDWSLIAVPLIPVSTTPIPEYPLGLSILAILTVLAYSIIRHHPLQLQFPRTPSPSRRARS